MAHSKKPARRSPQRRRRKTRSSFRRLRAFWPGQAARRRWWRRLRALPGALQIVALLLLCLAIFAAANWIYQVIRKPSELLFPVSGVLYKNPRETWETYAPLFRAHSTAVMTPELLAALAQVEASGNPIVRTYWRWRFGLKPFELYRPASSAVGMYQMTDGTFELARRFCIHDHAVAVDGPWNDVHSCWFNALYSRLLPTNAVELASAWLTHSVDEIVRRRGGRPPSLEMRQELAILAHLCGAGAGELYARRGYRLTHDQRCGDHPAHEYVSKVLAMRRSFVALAAGVQ